MITSKSVQLLIKRFGDIAASVVGLILLAPFFALVAIAIKIDSNGPILFRQERLGRDGELFEVLKLRTMFVDTPDKGVEITNAREDPRVTRVGALLRQWSFDELPQLINVLKGEMSLVGPRPDRVFRFPEYSEHRKRRLLMSPGLTGLAQVSGRNSIPWEERYEMDIAYVEKWSLWLDTKVLLKTFRVVANREGVDYI